jgi:Reverse transcriptase (RNA-dependent DNA polymerase)
MEGKEIFSKFDIRWGYNNIPIQTEDRFKGAFKTPLGTYQPRVLYFGMKNAPAQWTRLMLRHFKPWYDKWYNYKDTTGGSYMDDFSIGSKNTPKG